MPDSDARYNRSRDKRYHGIKTACVTEYVVETKVPQFGGVDERELPGDAFPVKKFVRHVFVSKPVAPLQGEFELLLVEVHNEGI